MTRDWDQVMANAVAILTEAAHLHHPTRPGVGHRQPRRIDFAEFVCLALVETANNLGGVEELLAGRPGSWEAHYVRELLGGT